MTFSYHIGLFRKLRVECFQFVFQDGELFKGVFGKTVDDEQQRVGAFDVLQELVPKTLAFAGAFQQARNIGHHEAVAVHLHDTENRL